jgi:thiamine kinase-like enzyme
MLAQAQKKPVKLIDDPRLPHLLVATEAEAMREHFARYFQQAYPALDLQVVHCAIEKIYYRPGRHCGMLYRLRLRPPSGRPGQGSEADEWFFGRMYASGVACSKFEQAAAAVEHFKPARNFLQAVKPVNFWPDLNMLFWVFPQDPKLPALPQAVDPAFIRKQVEANFAAFGLLGNGSVAAPRCADLRYDRVKYMPGKRCVLRFHARLDDAAGEAQEVTFYSKTYGDGMSRYHFQILQSAYRQLTAQVKEINLPRPLLHLDEANTFWQEEWKGKALIEALDEFDWDELFPRIAAMLASLHRSRINGFRPGPDLDDVLQSTLEDGAELVQTLPQYQPLISPLLSRLQTAKTALEQQEIAAVPIHGACRLEQMLVRGTELALVDFDAVALGDPLFDLAEFLASLQFLQLSRALPRQRLARAVDLFYETYARQVSWSCDRRRVAWYALSFLTSKIFLSLKNLDFQALQRLESEGQEIIKGWLEFIN